MTAPTVSATGPSGAQSTRRPTVTWTSTIDTGDQYGYQIKVYDLADQPSPNPASSSTTGVVWDTGALLKTSAVIRSAKMPNKIDNGSYRAYVRIAKLNSGAGQWSSWDYSAFSISSTPPAPTKVKPLDGSTHTTDRVTLSARLADESISYPATVRAQWQVASNAGFTTELRTISESSSKLNAGGIHSQALTASTEVFQGVTWYVRCRAVDQFGNAGSWSATNDFTVSHPPNALPVSPSPETAVRLDEDGKVTFEWEFTDASPGDSQVIFDVEVQRNDDGSSVTGEILWGTGGSHALAIDPAEKDVQLRWAVQLWDSDGIAGPFCDWQPFYISDGPSVTVVGPSVTVTSPQPTIEWTYDAAGGRAQTQYKVEVQTLVGELTVYETAWTLGDATSHQLATAALVTDESYLVTVTVLESAGLEASGTLVIATEWVVPEAAAGVAIDASLYDSHGYVELTWDGSAEDSSFNSWRVYRRAVDTVAWELLDETDLSFGGYTFWDYTAGAGIDYEYAVVQSAHRFEVVVESDYEVTEVSTEGTHYWLLDPDDWGMSIKLEHVQNDSYTDEHETAEMNLIGRGRRVEYGTHFGYRGELAASLRDNAQMTAREQRLYLERLKAEQSSLLLRTPFGDVWRVATGDISVERVPGLGLREFVTVTVPYVQIAD